MPILLLSMHHCAAEEERDQACREFKSRFDCT